jgi:hypothetical protein
MSTYSTSEVAEHMLTTGRRYTSSLLAKELGITSKQASGKLFNIRVSKKYTTVVTELPHRTIKLTAISGRQGSFSALIHLAIFGTKISKEAA